MNLKVTLYKKSIYFISIFLIVLSVLKFQNTQYNMENYTDQKNFESCTYDLLKFKKSLPSVTQVEVVNKPVSIIPELKNIYCLGTLNSFEIKNNRISIETSSSKRLEVAINFIVYFSLFFYRKINNNRNFLILITFNSFLINFLFDYNLFTLEGVFWLFLKVALFYLLYHPEVLKKNKKEYLFYFFIVTITADLLNKDLTFGELTYFGHALNENGINSSYIGDSHLYLFNFIIKTSNNLVPEYFKVLIELFLCIWFVTLFIKYKTFFNLNHLSATLFIFLFLSQQSILSGEFYFGAVEGKTFAYLSLLTSFIYSFEKQINKSCFFYILTFYFHASVAVVTFPIYFYLQLKYIKFEKVFKSNFISFLLTLPLIISLLSQNLFSEMDENSILIRSNLINMIVERAPHHLYPFNKLEMKYFEINTQWRFGFILMLVLTILLFFLKYFQKYQDEVLDIVIFLTYIFWIYSTLVFLYPFSQFTMLFPFRIGSVFLIFIYLFFSKFVSNLHNNSINIGVIFIITILLSQLFVYRQNDYYFDELKYNKNTELVDFIIDAQPSLLILPLYESSSMRSSLNFLELETSIPTYVTWKFNAYNIRDISVWRDRLISVEKFYDENCNEFIEYGEVYFIDYNQESKCGEIVFKSDNIYVFKLLK